MNKNQVLKEFLRFIEANDDEQLTICDLFNILSIPIRLIFQFVILFFKLV